jgi:hypothetical protein
MLAIDILEWPGMNQAFLFSLFATLVLTGLAVLYGKRRPLGTPTSWGEAMAGSTYAFFVMFLAYGIVPHQWLTHAQNELGWQSDKTLYGPFDIFKSQAKGGWFPFDISYLQVGDVIAALIYVVFGLMQIWIFAWWQKRTKSASTELETSAFGRPLVRKA